MSYHYEKGGKLRPSPSKSPRRWLQRPRWQRVDDHIEDHDNKTQLRHYINLSSLDGRAVDLCSEGLIPVQIYICFFIGYTNYTHAIFACSRLLIVVQICGGGWAWHPPPPPPTHTDMNWPSPPLVRAVGPVMTSCWRFSAIIRRMERGIALCTVSRVGRVLCCVWVLWVSVVCGCRAQITYTLEMRKRNPVV